MSIMDKVIAEGRDELTQEESHALVEEETQEYFGLTVEEFVRRAEEGTLPADDAMVVHLALLTGAKLKRC